MPVTPKSNQERLTPERCERDAEGRVERRREELKDEPCTVTAPAAAAGHRGPVWATKIGGDIDPLD